MGLGVRSEDDWEKKRKKLRPEGKNGLLINHLFSSTHFIGNVQSSMSPKEY
jgi:hypothetical protein